MQLTTKSRTVTQMVCFKLGPEEFGINILKVREIVRWIEMVQMPQTPTSMAGVINLRGNVIPVIDLRIKLGLEYMEPNDQVRIIVTQLGDKLIGVIVDQVKRVLRLHENQMDTPPDIGNGKIQEYITGLARVDDNLIILLNIDKIMTSEDIIELEEFKTIKETAQSEEKRIKIKEGKSTAIKKANIEISQSVKDTEKSNPSKKTPTISKQERIPLKKSRKKNIPKNV